MTNCERRRRVIGRNSLEMSKCTFLSVVSPFTIKRNSLVCIVF